MRLSKRAVKKSRKKIEAGRGTNADMARVKAGDKRDNLHFRKFMKSFRAMMAIKMGQAQMLTIASTPTITAAQRLRKGIAMAEVAIGSACALVAAMTDKPMTIDPELQANIDKIKALIVEEPHIGIDMGSANGDWTGMAIIVNERGVEMVDIRKGPIPCPDIPPMKMPIRCQDFPELKEPIIAKPVNLNTELGRMETRFQRNHFNRPQRKI